MGRSYKIGDSSYPSVTTVLGILDKSAALMPWAVNMALQYVKENADGDLETVLEQAKKEWRKVSQDAMDIGSAVHDAIECYIKHGVDKTKEEIYSKPDMSDDQKKAIDNAFLAFLEWSDDNGCEWIESEATVIDTENCYAGTLDGVVHFTKGEFAGRTMVIDFKSSKGFYDGYGKQVAAYRLAYECKEGCVQVDGCGVLRLDKATGEPEFKDYSKDYERKVKAFLLLLDFYYADRKRRLKNNPKVKENYSG